MSQNSGDYLDIEGKVTECLPGGKFLVELENGATVTTSLAGKMRLNNIKVLLGDRVTVSLSMYDLTQGRIKFRHKDQRTPLPPKDQPIVITDSPSE